jgi:mannose-6-phosphate isomerase-like protein (cupin superfamily)
MKREHITVKKYWGSEIWFENNSKYCGKLLKVYQKQWSSKGLFHYHKVKDETFFVIEGTLRIHIVDKKGEIVPIVLQTGESYRIKPLVKHRFTAITKICKFIEVSTHHEDDDSFRVEE